VPAKKKTKAAAQKNTATGSSSTQAQPLIEKQPRSKLKAAQDAGIFLAVDDSWTKSYFDSSDLHSLERKLFG
jgi:hypothetical protein